MGVQRQLANQMAVEVNFSYTAGRREEVPMNGNLSYNEQTGANNPFSTVGQRPFPDWGIVNFEWLAGWSNYYGTDFTLTKRYSNNWQLSGSYTLAYFNDASPDPRAVVHRQRRDCRPSASRFRAGARHGRRVYVCGLPISATASRRTASGTWAGGCS